MKIPKKMQARMQAEAKAAADEAFVRADFWARNPGATYGEVPAASPAQETHVG